MSINWCYERLIGAAGAVEEEEDGERDDGVGNGAEEFVHPVEMERRHAEQTAMYEEEQKAVEQGEAEVHEDAGGEVFDVYLDADAGGSVADDGLGHAVDADRLAGEGVLEQADRGACESSGDGVAAGDGEEDGDDKGDIKQVESRERLGQECLQEHGSKGYEQRDGWMEAVLLEFTAGGVAAGCHYWGSGLGVVSGAGGLAGGGVPGDGSVACFGVDIGGVAVWSVVE